MGFVETIGWIVIGAGMVVLVALLYMIPTWLLWNWLMPELFGLPKITIFQSLGLMMLSGCLFNSLSNNSKD